MEGRAAPTLPETFFSLYYNAIFKTHSRLGTIIGVSSMAAVFVIKETDQVLQTSARECALKKGPSTGTYPRIPAGALFQELQSMIPDWILQEVHKCRNNKRIEEVDEQASY